MAIVGDDGVGAGDQPRTATFELEVLFHPKRRRPAVRTVVRALGEVTPGYQGRHFFGRRSIRCSHRSVAGHHTEQVVEKQAIRPPPSAFGRATLSGWSGWRVPGCRARRGEPPTRRTSP